MCKESGKEGTENGEEMRLHLKVGKEHAAKIAKEGAFKRQEIEEAPPAYFHPQ